MARIILTLMTIMLAACGKSPSQSARSTSKAEINIINEIKVDDATDKTMVHIQAKSPLSPNVFKLTDPLRVVIDFTDTKLGQVNTPIPLNNGIINEITANQFDDMSSSLSRVVIGFDSMVDYEVTSQDNVLTLNIPKQMGLNQTSNNDVVTMTTPGRMTENLMDVIDDIPVDGADMGSTTSMTEATMPMSTVGDEAPAATKLTNVSSNLEGDQVNINLTGNGTFNDYHDFLLDNPKRLVIDLKNIKPALKKNKFSIQQGMVNSVRTGAHSDKIRVVIDFNDNSNPNYQVSKSNDGLVVMIGGGSLNMPIASNNAMDNSAPTMSDEETLVSIANLPLDEIPVDGDMAPSFTDNAVAEESSTAATNNETEPMVSSKATVLALDFVQSAGNSRLVIKTDAPVTYTSSDEGADTVILQLSHAKLSKAASRFLNTTAFNSPLSTVAPKQVGQDTRIVANLKEATPYQISQDGNFIYVDFARNKQFTTTETTTTAAPELGKEGSAADTAAPELLETPALAKIDKAENAAANVDLNKEAPDLGGTDDEIFFKSQPELKADNNTKYEYVKEGLLSDSMNAAGANTSYNDDMIFEGGGNAKTYTGRKINLDFKEADIRSLFRLFADISKLNIIVGDDVNGKVTIRLRDVPWDQAFAILLQTQNLGAIKYGNILRVAPAEKIQKERELHAQAKKAAVAAAPLDTLFKAVSYANAGEVAGHVKSVLSDRGTVNIDTRTNTIIVRDVREKLAEAKTLIDKLDAQTPQVTIEARIVEATDTFVRNWGVQWGASANFSPATGNPTGLLFPNSVGAVGSQNTSPPTGGTNPILLNYPSAGANASVTLNLGSINNVLDLDLLLGYEESEGNAKLVSSPKVTVLDNRPATILSGTKIPFITTTANSGNNVRFESAAISITVTPHITADGSVIMVVNASRNEPDFGQSVLGNPSIIQREASTEVLVKSGNTTVIGGIYRINKTRNSSGFPFLRHVPVLGWFFSNDNRRLDRQELLIFITPRIVGDERTVIRQVQG